MKIDILSEKGVAYFPEWRYFLGQENRGNQENANGK
jgi:hypothetical protein